MSGQLDTAPPVPIVAALRYDDDQVRLLQSATTRSAKKAALKAVHDDLAGRLGPQLDSLLASGLAIDHATSWLLAELVVHAPAGRVEEAIGALAAMPELRNVRRGSQKAPRRR